MLSKLSLNTLKKIHSLVVDLKKSKPFRLTIDAAWFKPGDTLVAHNEEYLYVWGTGGKGIYTKCLVERLPRNKTLRRIKETKWDIYRYLYNKNIMYL